MSKLALLALLLASLNTGCAGFFPLRYHLQAAPCTPDAQGRVPAPPPTRELSCANTAHEQSRDYELLFVEFDEQGLLHPASEYVRARQSVPAARSFDPDRGGPTTPSSISATEPAQPQAMPGQLAADFQIKNLLRTLAAIVDRQAHEGETDGLSIVVYVHGWHHNASWDDDDVRGFRKVLNQVAQVERGRAALYGAKPRRAVGIYVGWRGESLTLPWVNVVTFYDRMMTARHVATGQARALFSHLKGFEAERNGELRPAAAGRAVTDRKVRMLLIGHSFGALVLYSATYDSILESLVHHQRRAGGGPNNGAFGRRIGDLIVLINPAFEATRYLPLHRLAHESQMPFAEYRAPILVSITSEADQATRLAFPIGRFVTTLFEGTSSTEEADANRFTMGHVPRYITHRLTMPAAARGCDGWMALEDDPAATPERVARNLAIEARQSETSRPPSAVDGKPRLPPGWQRRFCGGTLLEHQPGFDPHSVIWNISTDEKLIGGHNDIQGAALAHFVRQVYADTERHDFEGR